MDTSPSATIQRSLDVRPISLEAKKFLLSPVDYISSHRRVTLSLPFFFDYDIDGDRFLEALKVFLSKYHILCGRIQPDEDTRYIVKVDPEKDGCCPFVEVTSELSTVEAIRDGTRFRAGPSDTPVQPEAPFFMDLYDHDALLKGKEPLVKVRLTHFVDGSCVCVALPHMIADGQRHFNILADISKAYRGIDIPDKDHDRSYLWPDRLAEHFDLGEAVAKLPRKIPKEPDSFPAAGFGDVCQNHALHFSNEVLEQMKERAKPHLLEGSYVSANDVLVAFFWLLESELRSHSQPIKTASDLDIDNTMTIVAFEILSQGLTVVPENYSGNAVFSFPLIYSDPGDDGDRPLSEVFAKLATISREATQLIKQTPAMAAQALLVYHHLVSGNKVDSPVPLDRMRMMLTNLMKLEMDAIDFGGGGAVYSCILPLPCTAGVWPLGSGHRMGGAVVQALMTERQKEIFDTSVVAKEFAPGMQNLFDLSADDLRSRLRFQK